MNFFINGLRCNALIFIASLVSIVAPVFADVADKPQGVSVWFRLEGNAKDELSTLTGSPIGATYSFGKLGKGARFDGSSRIEVPDDPRFDVQDFTLETWVRRTSTTTVGSDNSGHGVIFGGSAGAYSLVMSREGNFYMSHVGVASVYSVGQVTDTSWHHVALTKQGSSVRFFIDGEPAGDVQYATPFTFTGPFALGALGTPFDGVNYPFLGTMDELAFYPRALSEVEVRGIYQDTVEGSPSTCAPPADGLVAGWSGDGSAAGMFGGPSGLLQDGVTFTNGMVGQAFQFEGGSQRVEIPDTLALRLQSFTIEMWIKRSSTDRSSDSPAGAGLFASGFGGYSFVITQDGKLGLGHVGVAEFDTAPRVVDLNWHHVAVTKSDSQLAFYVDGVLTDTGVFEQVFSFDGPFAIGAGPLPIAGYYYSFLGLIDEVAIYNRALLADEIEPIWQAGKLGKCNQGLSVIFESIPEVLVDVGASYQLNVTNSGTNSLAGLVVTNLVPVGIEVTGTETQQGSSSVTTSDSGSVVVYQVGTLAPGAKAGLAVQFIPRIPGVQNVFATVSGAGDVQPVSTATTFLVRPECVAVPMGLTGWWRGESNGVDAISGRAGSLSNGVSFVTGRVGRAFHVDGQTGSGVDLGALPGLQRSVFTIEGWLRRGSLTTVSLGGGAGTILGADTGGWNFSLLNNGALTLGKTEISRVDSEPVIHDLGWHHVAVTRSPSEVRFLVDGQLVATRPYTETFILEHTYGLGGLFPTGRNVLLGDLDEISFYERILSAEELATLAGSGSAPKCVEDLMITSTAGGPVALGEDFTASFLITSEGGDSTAVTFTNAVPAGMQFQSATTSQGTIENLAGFLRGNLGTIAAGSNAVVTVVFRPLVEGVYPLVATVGRAEAELTLANNRFESSLEVRVLSVSLVGDVTVLEQAGAPAVAEFEIVLSAPSTLTVQVDYATTAGTASAGEDFTAQSGRLEFPPGTVSRLVTVPVAGDGLYELDEQFQLGLTNVVNAALGAASATGNIISGDPMPVLRVQPVLAAEGNGGATPFRFQATLDRPAGVEASVNYATTNDTARAPTDYLARTGTLVFAPGETNQTLEVTVNGDTSIEANELFFLTFSAPHYLRFATPLPTPVAGTIVNDDSLSGQVAAFSWETPAAGVSVGEAFAAALTARDGTGAVAPGFSGVVSVQAFAGPGRPGSVVFTEVVASQTSGVELQNVTPEAIDLSGWSVTLYDATRWPAPKGAMVIPAGTVVVPGGVFTVEGGFGAPGGTFPRFRLGQSLTWNDRGTPAEPKAARIGAVLTNPYGQVEEAFFADGAEPSEVGVPALINTNDWAGEPVVALLGQNTAYRRVAALDRNSRRATDWEQYRPLLPNLGQPNPGLAATFADAVPLTLTPPTVAEFVAGQWSGPLILNGYAPEVRLLADDGNGHRGLSASLPVRVVDDLAVTLTTDSPVLAIPTWSAQFFVTVTNLGPVLSSNVTATVLLASAYGTGSEVVLARQISQGVSSVATVFTPGVGTQTKVTANFGDLPPAGVATLQFSAHKGSGITPQTVPTSLVSSVVLVREPVEVNLLNNTATVVQELSQLCAPLGESVAGWWRADGAFGSLFNELTATPVGEAGPGEGRVGSGGFHFDGVGDALRVADHASLDFGASQSFTLELWLRIPATVKPLLTLLNKQQGTGTNAVGYALGVRSGVLQLELGDGTTFQTWTFGPTEVRDGNWHHLVVSVPRAGEGSLGAWLDARDISGLPANVLSGDLSNDAPLRLGESADPDTDGFLAGDLDEVVIYRRALTSVEASRAARAGAHGHCTSELSFQPIRPRFQLSNLEWLALDAGVAGQPYHVDLELRNTGPLRATVATWVSAADPLTRLQVQIGSETVQYNPETGVAMTSPLVIPAGGVVPLAVTLSGTNASVQLTLLPQGGGVSERRVSAVLRIPLAADTDGDGIPDAVETAAGLNPGSAADAASDTDGDGWTAAQEFEAGTLANDPNSALRLRVVDGQVVFEALASRVYRLEHRATIGAEDWTLLQTLRPETDGTLVIGPLLGEEASGYYRVLAAQPY